MLLQAEGPAGGSDQLSPGERVPDEAPQPDTRGGGPCHHPGGGEMQEQSARGRSGPSLISSIIILHYNITF